MIVGISGKSGKYYITYTDNSHPVSRLLDAGQHMAGKKRQQKLRLLTTSTKSDHVTLSILKHYAQFFRGRLLNRPRCTKDG